MNNLEKELNQLIVKHGQANILQVLKKMWAQQKIQEIVLKRMVGVAGDSIK